MQWHANYSRRISFFVIPLMFGQVICAGLILLNDPSIGTILNGVLIVLVWLATFLRAVPLHRQFAEGIFDESLFKELCKRNWSRTFLWTCIFLLNLI